MTLDIAAIKARADKVPEILVTHCSPWYFSMDGVKDANQCWMFKGTGALDGLLVELANYASTARTDIPGLIAALEVSESARVKAEQEVEVRLSEIQAQADFIEKVQGEREQWKASDATRVSSITALEQERDADMKRAYLKGRTQWCPAGILDDTERTERDWQDARRALEAKP